MWVENYVFDPYTNFLIVNFLGSEFYFNDETAEVSFAGFNMSIRDPNTLQLEPVEDVQKCKFAPDFILHKIITLNFS